MADTRTDPQYKLRLPQDLKDRIERAAREQGRSMNAEILMTLEMHYPPLPEAEEILPVLEGVLRMSDAGRLKGQWNNLYNLLHELRYRLEAEVNQGHQPKDRSAE